MGQGTEVVDPALLDFVNALLTDSGERRAAGVRERGPAQPAGIRDRSQGQSNPERPLRSKEHGERALKRRHARGNDAAHQLARHAGMAIAENDTLFLNRRRAGPGDDHGAVAKKGRPLRRPLLRVSHKMSASAPNDTVNER